MTDWNLAPLVDEAVVLGGGPGGWSMATGETPEVGA